MNKPMMLLVLSKAAGLEINLSSGGLNKCPMYQCGV